MTLMMWIESFFEHFSIPFTIAFLVGLFTWIPTKLIWWIGLAGILGVEIYQLSVWGWPSGLAVVDMYLDMIYGFAGLWLALRIIDNK